MASTTNLPAFRIGERFVGPAHPPLVIAEIGINHGGDVERALRMVDDAARAGCECVKLQSHLLNDEMIPNSVVPANANNTIWDIIDRSSLSAAQERAVKARADELGVMFLSTPFSREAADRLAALDVAAFKIGSGECNNLPLVNHVAAYGKPVILSTGMNDLASVHRTVSTLRDAHVPYALLHCTSIYPTPEAKIRLGAIPELRDAFPDAVVGLSDHSLTNYPAIASVALGASILERHFTSDRNWEGPDIEISMDPDELAELVTASRLVHEASGGSKTVLPEERPTIEFAYASVVTIAPVRAGDAFTSDNVWVKRPGTGEILAPDFDRVVTARATRDLEADVQLSWSDVAC